MMRIQDLLKYGRSTKDSRRGCLSVPIHEYPDTKLFSHYSMGERPVAIAYSILNERGGTLANLRASVLACAVSKKDFSIIRDFKQRFPEVCR